MIRQVKEGQVVYEGAGSKGVRLHTANQCEYLRLSIVSGAGIDRHQLPMPVTFFVLSGRGILTSEEGVMTVEPGELIELPPDMPREWQNPGPEGLELLVIKHLT